MEDDRNDLRRRLGESKEEGKSASGKLLREIDELVIRVESMR